MTDFTRDTFTLHTSILWFCAVAAVLVFTVMIYSIATFRKAADGAVRSPHGAVAEIFWAVIPIVIVITMSVPAVRTLVLWSKAAAPHNTAEDHRNAFQPVSGQL